jgi:pyruvate dehydrogenase E2 component (dihydrolipoamide acetyltransferase)
MEPSRKSPADAEQIPKKSTVQLQENQIINQEMSPNSAVARIKVSPLARRRAEELGIDLLTIKTAHADGIISVEDIEQAAKGVTEKSKNEQLENSRQALRGAIAAAMSKSKREIPHYYLQTSIDMSRTIAWLEKENSQRTIVDRLLPVVVLLKAVAKALKKVPQLNGYWVDGKIQVLEEIHIGFAISMTGGGLVAPAMHHVDSKDLDQLMSDLRELIPRARSGRLRSSELTDATVTITSLGDLGVESVTGIIYPPQVALIGLGKILSRPWVDSGVVCVKPVMIASLSADHRATDGLLGAKFLDTLATILQEPQTL